MGPQHGRLQRLRRVRSAPQLIACRRGLVGMSTFVLRLVLSGWQFVRWGWRVLRALFDLALAFLEIAKHSSDVSFAEATFECLVGQLLPGENAKPDFSDEKVDQLLVLSAEEKRAEIVNWLGTLPLLMWRQWSDHLRRRIGEIWVNSTVGGTPVTDQERSSAAHGVCHHVLPSLGAPALAGASFFGSSFELTQSGGVRVALMADGSVLVRGAQDSDREPMCFSADEWRDFLARIKGGDRDA